MCLAQMFFAFISRTLEAWARVAGRFLGKRGKAIGFLKGFSNRAFSKTLENKGIEGFGAPTFRIVFKAWLF